MTLETEMEMESTMYNVVGAGTYSTNIRDYYRIDQDHICCGLARIHGIRARPFSREDEIKTAMWQHDMNTRQATAHVKAKVGTLVDADGLYEYIYKEIDRSWGDSSCFMLSDNVCVHAGVYNGSYNADEVSTFKFTEWVKRNNKGTIFEGPVTFNPNENSYVQLRFWIPDWVEGDKMHKNMATYLQAEKDCAVYRDHDDDDDDDGFYDDDGDDY